MASDTAKQLFLELYREWNNDFQHYGQHLNPPPTLEEAMKMLGEPVDAELTGGEHE